MPTECERSDTSPPETQQKQTGEGDFQAPELTREEKINALEKMDFGKDVQSLNNEMSSSQTSTTSSNNSLNGSVISNGSGRKSSLISPDPTAYVTKARVTRPTPPPPPYNPMQFVQIKPCNLYQTAQQQLKKAEEVKKIKEIKKEEPEDWQNNLDNWKSSRRKRVEHIIDRVVEVKKLELEEHDRTRRKSKTFSEMMEKRGERNGGRGLTKLASLAVYNEDESNDFSDLGIGTSSASGKSSVSEDYDNNSVLSDNTEMDKAIFENKEKENSSTTRECTSSPGYETSSSTAAASSPDPCEYTYEGAIQDYKQRVSRATAKSTNNFNKFYSNNESNAPSINQATAGSTISTKDLPSHDQDRFKNGSNDCYPTRRGSKIEDRLNSFEVTSPSDTQENAETKKVDVPKIDISKRKEIFEQQQQQQQKQQDAKTNGSSHVPKVALKDRFKVDSTDGGDSMDIKKSSPKKDVKRLSGDISSIKERLQSLEQQKNASSNSTNETGKNVSTNSKMVDVPVPPLKDRLSSLQNAATKEEIKKPPVALVDARQLEIMKNEEEQRIRLMKEQQPLNVEPLSKASITSFIEEEKKGSSVKIQVEKVPKVEEVDRDDSGIHTADDIEADDRLPELMKSKREEELNAAIAALALEEKQLEDAANAVNKIEAEFAELTLPQTVSNLNPVQHQNQNQQHQHLQQSQPAQQPPLIEMEFSQINEALELALEEIDKEVEELSIKTDNKDHDNQKATIKQNQHQNENEYKIKNKKAEEKDILEQENHFDNKNTLINSLNDKEIEKTHDELEKQIAREPIYENIQKTKSSANDLTNSTQLQLTSPPQPQPPLPLQVPPTASTSTIVMPMHDLDLGKENIPNNNKNNSNTNNFSVNSNQQNQNLQNFICNENQRNILLSKEQKLDFTQGLCQLEKDQEPRQTNNYNYINNVAISTANTFLTNSISSTNNISKQNLGSLDHQSHHHLTKSSQNDQQNLQLVQDSQITANKDFNGVSFTENEPYYQVPKSSEPYYDAPKHLRPIPVYENIEIFYNGIESSTLIAPPSDFARMEPPKEKPPPPPCDSPPLFDDVDGANTNDTWSSADNTYETIPTAHRRQQKGHLAVDQPSPPIQRMNSTKRIKKELRNKRSSFLGIEDSMENDESYLELTVAPPPDMAQLLQEERRLEKQLYLKAGLCDSSDTGESRDSGVSENHSRQSSEHYTNSSEENESHNGSDGMPSLKQNEIIYQNESPTLLTAAQTPLLQTVKGNSAESWTESATVAAAATKSLTEAQATANAKMLSIEEKIREQEQVLRVERELLHFSQEELKRQRENLLLRENMARMELQHGAKMLMSANRHSLQDLNGLNMAGGMMQVNNGFQPTLVPPAAQALRAQHIYANIPNLQQQYYRQADMDYRKSMSDLNEFSKRMSLPPVPPTKPMRAMHISTNGHADDYSARQRHSLNAVNSTNYAGSLVKIATPLPTAAPRAAVYSNFHHQSAQNLNQIPNVAIVNGSASNANGGQAIHHGNMTRNTLHALSATPKPKYTDDWVQVQTRKNFESSSNLANDPAWLSAYQQKRKSMPDSYHGYNNNHWMVQEAEQRRIVEQQSRRNSQNTKAPLSSNNSNGKPLPDSIIQTLTERVQSKGIGERKRFDNYSSANNSPSHFAVNYQHQNYSNVSSPVKHPAIQQQQQQSSHLNSSKTANVTNGSNTVASQDKILSVSGKKKCSHCGEELGRGAAMIIESLLLFYHINCFKCCVCHVQLGDGLNGTDVRVRNHKLHCQNCYSSDDGIKFSCV